MYQLWVPQIDIQLGQRWSVLVPDLGLWGGTVSARAARARPALVRTSRRSRAVPVEAYRRRRAAVALALFIMLFGFFWMCNGSFTAEAVVARGGSAELGWALHLTMSAVELTPVLLWPLRGVPRWGGLVVAALSLPFGIFDVWSSAIGVATWFTWTGASGLLAHAQNVALAEMLAFLPEPMLVWLFLAIRQVLR